MTFLFCFVINQESPQSVVEICPLPVWEQSIPHIWQPWAHGPTYHHSPGGGAAVCFLPASQ